MQSAELKDGSKARRPPGTLHELPRNTSILFQSPEDPRIPGFLLLTSSHECQEGKDHYWQTNANIFLPPAATFVLPESVHTILAEIQAFLLCYTAALAKSQGISSLSFREEKNKILPRAFGRDRILM